MHITMNHSFFHCSEFNCKNTPKFIQSTFDGHLNGLQVFMDNINAVLLRVKHGQNLNVHQWGKSSFKTFKPISG